MRQPQGVLTVGLIRCINLKTKSPEPDIYVQIRLSDPELHTNYPVGPGLFVRLPAAQRCCF